MKAEAASTDPDRLVPPDLIRVAEEARAVQAGKPPLGMFFSTDDVILVPGFMGSELTDVGGPDGLIWIDPFLVAGTGKLLDLALAPYPTRPDEVETDLNPAVTIRPNGEIPVIYSGLKYDLEVRRYSVEVFGFDWRRNIEESAANLAGLIRDRADRRFRPLHLIAHSQGTIVARRALQLVGANLARGLVNNLVLLGPATAGTFSAAFAIAGNPGLLESVRRFHISPPEGFDRVLQSMSGLYQLLPWRSGSVTGAMPDKALKWVHDHREAFGSPAFWESGVDTDRLARLGPAPAAGQLPWGQTVDASFFNDRTTLILGNQPTVGGVKFEGGVLVADADFTTEGDGTVPDSLALISGVSRVYKAKGAEHMMLPATLSVMAAVRDVLAGRVPQLDVSRFGAAAGSIPFLAEPPVPPPPVRTAQVAVEDAGNPPAQPPGPPSAPAVRPIRVGGEGRVVPEPPVRRLRVFSFDPLLGTDLDALGTDQITLELPWDFTSGDHLEPGPVGEYLEVVDYDPASGAFYPPVDLNHPHLLAQDGMAPSEGDPRFHQQMAFAVAMGTISQFEKALGRVALWAPQLVRDANGQVIPGATPEDEYVRRLRIYPHALRQANAFYHPDKKALLFGYFPAQGVDVGRNLPGGTVFACLSYDIVAHETTHALLDGLHRYLIEPSHPDVFAFHEGFADVVAMFQHFSHPEVLRYQIGLARGDLDKESMLGVLAAQFGEATGNRAALRQYLGKRDEEGRWRPIPPDPTAIRREGEPHARGAILVAALFRAFRNIYEIRVKDLRRIATGGTGVLPNGDLHPDLVGRMAAEAAKAARHMLTMCIRALDYIPPVDLTFGEYLRALLTADAELVRDDDLHYRVAVVAAFRDWGIYPKDVRALSVDSLLWSPPELSAFQHPIDLFASDDVNRNGDGGAQGKANGNGNASASPDGPASRLSGPVRAQFDQWNLRCDRRRAFLQMRQNGALFHAWLADNVTEGRDHFLGLALDPKSAPGSIRRDSKGLPVFEVHSLRPCRRIGPDGQERTDLVVEIVQRRKGFFDEARQKAMDSGQVSYDDPVLGRQDFYHRGGCTLIIDPGSGDVRYCIRKAIWTTEDERLVAERKFRLGQFGDKVGGAYLSGSGSGNPFAFLHGGS